MILSCNNNLDVTEVESIYQLLSSLEFPDKLLKVTVTVTTAVADWQ